MGQDKKNTGSSEKLIASNPHARWNYFIEEVFEAGLVLKGTEVKSLRSQSPNLKEAYVEVEGRGPRYEGWLVSASIALYENGNIWNHEPSRRRKLLLHEHQLAKIHASITQKGMTVVPLRLYFKNGIAKVEIGIGKGKKNHDKREALKKKSIEREISSE